jgi:hypothetical protein
MKTGFNLGGNMFNCAKCYPRLCRCPVSRKEEIQRLKLALDSNLWDKKEEIALKEELKALTGE